MYANKQDLPYALRVEEVARQLGLEDVKDRKVAAVTVPLSVTVPVTLGFSHLLCLRTDSASAPVGDSALVVPLFILAVPHPWLCHLPLALPPDSTDHNSG